MELNEYQERAMRTCMPSSENFSYMMLNLVGELGEFASKIAKGIRKDELDIEANRLCQYHEDGYPIHIQDGIFKDNLKYEAGDILWQLSGLCKTFGWTLEEVAQANLLKLSSRQQRGVINGEGDNR